MFTAFLASLACLTLRSDSLAALAAATATPTPCDACDGHGEHGHGPDAVECRACGCTGERLVSAWDEDRDSARRRVLAATLVPCDRAALPAARSHAAALRASLQMTARRTLLTHRVCPCCHELRDAVAFEPDGACELCHIDLSAIAAAQHDAARTAIEAELETWPVAPPALAWELDSEPESDEVECPACDGHGDVPSGRHSAHDPLGLVECKCCRGERFVSRRSLLNASAREVA